jgi:hypothetical protein
MPGCDSGAVVLPWSSPRSQHHAAVARKIHLSRLFRYSQPPLLTDAALIDAMMAHPILINRPIVVTEKGAELCRPSEKVLTLLANPVSSYVKEDGEVVTLQDPKP